MPSNPEKEFIFPIKPNTPNTLAGTMGELRSTHFHNGIDIRTGGQSGLAVHAAADGYIVRVSVSPGGYGNALYLKHPDGKMTVYAHLESFHEDIAEYVLREQYRTQQFAINLFPTQDQFVFRQGEIIALSGNSGSSGGPHLHFDIRSSDNDLLAPLQFEFNEITDTRPPEVRKFALKTLDRQSRINGQFGRFEFDAIQTEDGYSIKDTIQMHGKVGVELYAYDRQNNTRFRTGIREIKVEVDDKTIYNQVIDRLSFSEKSSFYVHTDFRSLVTNNSRYHKLYVDDGNNLSIYSTDENKGRLMVFDEQIHKLNISMSDPYNNKSVLNVIYKGSPLQKRSKTEDTPQTGYDIIDNTLVVVSHSSDALIFEGNSKFIQGPDYWINDSLAVYLLDLRSELPDSIDLNDEVIRTNLDAMVPSGQLYEFYSETAEIEFGPRDLYDTIYFTYDHRIDTTYGDYWEIGNTTVPIKRTITAKLKPQSEVRDKERTLVYKLWGKDRLSFAGGEWEDNSITFYTRSFGNYVLATDSIPPTITPGIINSEKLTFKVDDNLSGIKSIKATINGDWVLMNHDPKTRRIWTEKLDKNNPFSGEFILEITDNVGNISRFKRNI
jgi:murein DD-endopeptidase MepM/ murein hydrolase activator NlpD